jgi:hypothetical protein
VNIVNDRAPLKQGARGSLIRSSQPLPLGIARRVYHPKQGLADRHEAERRCVRAGPSAVLGIVGSRLRLRSDGRRQMLLSCRQGMSAVDHWRSDIGAYPYLRPSQEWIA